MILGQSWGGVRPPAACPAVRPQAAAAAAAGWVVRQVHRLWVGLLMGPRSCHQAAAVLDIETKEELSGHCYDTLLYQPARNVAWTA